MFAFPWWLFIELMLTAFMIGAVFGQNYHIMFIKKSKHTPTIHRRPVDFTKLPSPAKVAYDLSKNKLPKNK